VVNYQKESLESQILPVTELSSWLRNYQKQEFTTPAAETASESLLSPHLWVSLSTYFLVGMQSTQVRHLLSQAK
jgi:hypothetical protein